MTNHPNRSRPWNADFFTKLDRDVDLLTAIQGVKQTYRNVPDEGHKKFATALAQVIVDSGYPPIDIDDYDGKPPADDPEKFRMFFGHSGGLVPLPIGLSNDMLLKMERQLSREGKL